MFFFFFFNFIFLFICFFFFSSRRRHTRFDCDWSSDVCSSDLPRPRRAALGHRADRGVPGLRRVRLADGGDNFGLWRPALGRYSRAETSIKEIQMNSSSNLLVLGATGQVGKLVARHLRRSDANLSVGTRRKAILEELAGRFGASRFIDLDDPRTFHEALKNITGLFLITGYTVDMLVQSKSLIDAAKRNGINHIVRLGAFTRDHDAYATVFAWHQMIEAYLRDSGIAWTTLHPNMFMQSFLSIWSIKGGVYNAYTSKAVGFTALEDVAEAAAVILMEGPDKHNGKDD